MSLDNTSTQIDLAGQVAIVTGGGRGIGRAIAQTLAEAGAAMAVCSRTQEEVEETARLIEEAGGRALPFTADVTDQPALGDLVTNVEEQLGPIDLLVSNAGVTGPAGPAWEVDPDAWWRCVDVNLRGPFLCARAVLPGMVARRRGRIITVASGSGLAPVPNDSAYAVAKCAAIRLCENLAVETKAHGIKVFAICPGSGVTPLWRGVIDSGDDDKWFNGLFRRVWAEGRTVPPERAAELVLFLASGKADGLSGCIISVHDDVAEMAKRAGQIQEGKLHTLRLQR